LSISKRLEAARRAFEQGSQEASAIVHDPQHIARSAQEDHAGAESQYIGDLVYGGLDGIITTFAVVSGVAGANLGAHVILILGLANLLGDGFSMGAGAYLSTKSEQEYYERERKREAWEVEHFPEGERAELYELYRLKGYSEEDAHKLVEIQSQEKELWVDAMMINELGLLKDERKPITSALATFAAFAVAGTVPLLVYVLGLFTKIPPNLEFPVSLGLSAVALFSLGAARVLVTRRGAIRSGLEMLLVGGLASAVAFAVGALLKGLGGS
jgi:VIT1/CCC1 family predicted Fe2+/Mn2+ transporter